MADHAAWGDDMIDLDREDREPMVYIDWRQRGNFKCDHCEKVLKTLDGLKSHMKNVHNVSADALRSKLKSDQKAIAEAEKARRESERREAEARRHRKVVLTTAEIDEIVTELNSLIDMMEAYYSQGDCDKSARDLIDRLEAKADGRS
ncbi:hypothetical protein DXT97_12645 [Agrobacterium tumefaciens]|uniref:C2H2-type zinc finger protein n=1 Tax=Agrobacterium tumefaciens TaxID=358 RepID=UPI001296800F|nr:C2H2-type zinc finger protein [Agrobacterium tumefaciens]MQB37641.1 hypothetical protein [Agrobacterium tumefaciens]